MQPLRPGEVDKRLVQRQRLDHRCQLIHHRADRAGRVGINIHPRLQDNRVGAEFERLEHRHGRADTANTRDIAGGRDHAAPSAADDQGFVGQFGVVAFLDTGVEGVAIHMRDGQVIEFRMRGHPRAAAGGAARSGIELGQAIAAKGRHGTRPMNESLSVSPAEIERSRFHGAKLALFLGDELAVILRDERPDIPWPGHWDLPGGGREGEESPEACVLRELREELGLCLAESDLDYARAYHRDGLIFWFLAARMPAALANDIVFGAEGQLWQLMPATAYLSHTNAVPQFQTRLRDYLETCG